MNHLLRWSVVAALVCAPAAAQAQMRADPGVPVGRSVVVRVHLTFYDEEAPYVPVTGHRVEMRSPDGTVYSARSDEAGVVNMLLPPGEYRLATVQPAVWRGMPYQWDVTVMVKPFMGIVELTARNALSTPAAAIATGPRPVVPSECAEPGCRVSSSSSPPE